VSLRRGAQFDEVWNVPRPQPPLAKAPPPLMVGVGLHFSADRSKNEVKLKCWNWWTREAKGLGKTLGLRISA
jgi:hypothetical protein